MGHPDYDAVYIASKAEVVNWAIRQGYGVYLPKGVQGLFKDHAFVVNLGKQKIVFIPRAFAYEFLGFAAGAKYWFRRPKTAWAYVAAWYRGHRALVRDWQYLKALVRQPLPEDRPR
jgi:hypothetical protein